MSKNSPGTPEVQDYLGCFIYNIRHSAYFFNLNVKEIEKYLHGYHP